jgi:hypothetical protein
MRLLHTSAGIENASVHDALVEPRCAQEVRELVPDAAVGI